MSAVFSAGSVVHAVAGHRDDVALLLQRLHEPDLVLRGNSGDDPDLLHLLVELLVGQRRELGARERPALDPQLRGDRGGRRHVVACDHPCADPGLPTACDRVLRLLARRVDDRHQGEQRQVLHLREEVAARVERGGVEVLGGDRQHAQPFAREPVVLGRHALHALRSRNGRPFRAPDLRRACEQDVRSSLDVAAHDLAPVILELVERRHELVLRVERHLRHARIQPPRLVDVDPALRREHDEGRLGRVAHDLAVVHRGVVGERHRHQERLERRVRLAPGPEDLPGRRVALAVDREAPARDDELSRRHLVQRQRAGLVRADRRGRAERLHRAQPLDDRALGRERLRAEREHGRHDRGQAGRDGGDGQADPDQEEIVEALAPDQPENDDEHQRRGRHDRQEHGQLVELARERGLLLLNLAQHP